MRISVIIPAYNAGPYLAKAVQSVLETNYRNLEILIIDDGSTDNSFFEVTTSFKKYSCIIKILRHKDLKNHGMTASRNLGIVKSTGDAICFLDADDLFLPHRFNKSAPILANFPAIDGVYEAVGLFFESEKEKIVWGNRTLLWPTVHVHNSNDLLTKMLLKKMGTWQAGGILVRKNLFNKTGLFTATLKGVNKKVEDDTHLFYQMAAIGNIISGEVEKPVVLYRRHKNNSWELNSLDDFYRDIFVIKHVLKWALKKKDNINQRNILVLKQSFRLRVISYLKMLRKENKRPTLMALLTLFSELTPNVFSERLFWGNLAYSLLLK